MRFYPLLPKFDKITIKEMAEEKIGEISKYFEFLNDISQSHLIAISSFSKSLVSGKK